MTDDQFRYLMGQYGAGSSASGGPPLPPPGGGMPAGQQFPQGRLQQNISDFTTGGRPTNALQPGFMYGQNVMSTDQPTTNEKGYMRFPEGNYQMRDQFLARPQTSNSPYQGNTAPWVEPTPIGPTGRYLPPHQAMNFPQLPPNDQGLYYPPNVPHEGVDFPTGANVPHEGVDFPTGANVPHQAMDFGSPWDQPDIGYDLPPSPDFGPSDQYLPNDYGPATVMEPTGNRGIYDPGSYTPFTDFGGGFAGGDQRPIYDPNTYTPFEDFSNGPGNYVPPGSDMYGGGFDVTAPAATGVNEFTQPIPTDYVSDPFGTGGGNNFNNPYYQDQYAGGGGNAPTAAPGAAFDPNAAAPNQFAPNTFTTGGNAPGPSMPFQDPNDPNNNLARGGISMPLYPTSNEVFPGADPKGPVQFFKDAGGNIVDAAGKLVMTAATAAAQVPGQLSNMFSGIANNIMNDPGWSSPDYLASMGYTPGAGTESMWPGQASNTNFGAGGEGGSFFGGTMQLNPGGGDLSVTGGQVIRSSVGPPQGGGGPPMWGPMNLGSLWGGAINNSYMRRMMKGIYTSPQDFGLAKQAMPGLPKPGGGNYPGGMGGGNWNTFHQGQVTLHDILVSHPEIMQNFLARGGQIGQGPPQKTSRHTPQNQPV